MPSRAPTSGLPISAVWARAISSVAAASASAARCRNAARPAGGSAAQPGAASRAAATARATSAGVVTGVLLTAVPSTGSWTTNSSVLSPGLQRPAMSCST